jgi:hypothetical protein
MAQRVLIEIAGARYVEPGGLQGLRNQAGIVRRRRKCARLVIGVADDERNALFRRCGVHAG